MPHPVARMTMSNFEKQVTIQDVLDFIADDNEMMEIIRDLINGDYTIQALREDYEEARNS